MRRLFFFLILIAPLAAILGGCGGTSSTDIDDFAIPMGHSDFREIDPDGWRYSDTITFPIPATMTGEMRVAIRHSIDYPYRNIWLEITRLGPDSGARPVRDTVDLELADPFGLWRGTGIGPTRQAEGKLRGGMPVTLDSGTTVMLRHIMRLDTLPAVSRVGLFVIH